METTEGLTKSTPIEDLREWDLKHYEEASSKLQHWTNSIPRAINFWYDYKQMTFFGKIKQAFKR